MSGQVRHHYALVGGRVELVKIACAAVTIDLVRVRVRVRARVRVGDLT